MKRAGLLVFLPFALAGCSLLDATGPDSGPLLRTDSTRYTLRLVPAGSDGYVAPSLRMNIAYTFTNRSGHEVGAGGCGHPDLPLIEKKGASGWTTAWGGFYLMCYIDPLPIAEGKSYSGTLRVVVPATSPSAAPQWPAGAVEGTYRLRWPALEDVTDVQRTSNEFAIVASWLAGQPPAEGRF